MTKAEVMKSFLVCMTWSICISDLGLLIYLTGGSQTGGKYPGPVMFRALVFRAYVPGLCCSRFVLPIRPTEKASSTTAVWMYMLNTHLNGVDSRCTRSGHSRRKDTEPGARTVVRPETSVK